MDKRTFFSMQNVQPDELNGLQTAIQTAISRNNYETLGYGVVYGMGLGPTSPNTMAVKVTKGVALYNPNLVVSSDIVADIAASRITLSADLNKTLTVDYSGSPTSVTSGQERWLALVAVPAVVNSDPRTDGSGAAVNFVNTEAGDVYVVKGTSAPVGSGAKVGASTVRALGVRLGDILISSSTSIITDPASFDLSLREQVLRLLHPDDDGNGNGAQASLFWQSFRSASGDGHGIVRAYTVRAIAGGPPAGITITLNTYWDPTQKLWIPDSSTTSAGPCMALRFQSNGFLFTQRTQGVSTYTGWVDTADGNWCDVTSPGNDDSMLMSALGLKLFGNAKSALFQSNGVAVASGGAHGVDDSTVTVGASVVGPAGTISTVGGTVAPLGVFVPFPRPFATTPTAIVIHGDTDVYNTGLGHNDGLGSAYDANVSAVYVTPTPYGIQVLVVPTALSLNTSWRRIISVSA